MRARQQLILALVLTDQTFQKRQARFGEAVWQGKCIHCGCALVVGLDGSCGREVTVEHIIPQHHGGDEALENLALSCARCNHQKGYMQDPKKRGDTRLEHLIQVLQSRRKARWRPLPTDEPSTDES